MNQSNYVTKIKGDAGYKSTNTNIVELINRAKLSRKKEKRNVVIVMAAALSVLAVTGIVITL
jgi:hypothetical protein